MITLLKSFLTILIAAVMVLGEGIGKEVLGEIETLIFNIVTEDNQPIPCTADRGVDGQVRMYVYRLNNEQVERFIACGNEIGTYPTVHYSDLNQQQKDSVNYHILPRIFIEN